MATLFVCEANAGLSQIAEALTRHAHPFAEVWSAGVQPSHVRPEVREVLREAGVHVDGLRAKPMIAVPLDEITLLVRLGMGVEDVAPPNGARVIDWRLPDPAAYPVDERLDAYRASRDELERRIKTLPAEDLR